MSFALIFNYFKSFLENYLRIQFSLIENFMSTFF